jgi:cytochrome subunit of sulfide dehydrogenase
MTKRNCSVVLRGARPVALLAAIALSATFSAPIRAQTNPDNTRYLASNCANCHGTNGASNVPGAFQLAGQKAEYIVEQMRAFKDGKTSATIMHQIAKGYSDEQVAALANYFSKQPKAK